MNNTMQHYKKIQLIFNNCPSLVNMNLYAVQQVFLAHRNSDNLVINIQIKYYNGHILLQKSLRLYILDDQAENKTPCNSRAIDFCFITFIVVCLRH